MSFNFKKDLICAANSVQKKGLDVERGYYSCVCENAYKCLPEDMHAFKNGDGNEWRCGGKACAVHSSSMLAYNFFSWINVDDVCRIDEVDYDARFFEVRIPCLKTSRANMDVVLLSKDKKQALFIESKFTEHFSKASSKMKTVSDAYLDITKYYAEDDFWKNIIEYEKKEAEKGGAYYDGIKQEICHLMAIYNLIRRNAKALAVFYRLNQECHKPLIEAFQSGMIESYQFMSLLYEPQESSYKKEHKAFNNYCKIHSAFIENDNLRNYMSQDLKICQKTYSQLWEALKKKMPEELKTFLKKRYMDNLAM